nr:reverse transcriptase domain-containing protein [Tanacetum cinerariifolium]
TARWWLEKEPPRSIHTREDLVSKFINEFFPPSRTTNLRNEISNFQQRFDESFHEACDRYKDLLRACPHHGFTELHQLDTFYNALNPADQDSLNTAAGGNLLEKRTQDVLRIIENKSKVHYSRNKAVVSQVKSCDANFNSSSEIAKLTHAVNQQMSVMTTAMTAILKQFQATPPPTSVKAVEEICVTYGGAHSYYQCLAAGGNTFPELRDNIQGCVSAAVVNYNQAGIARDVFVSVGKFTFLADFVIVNYECDPRVPLILGRPFLRTARALIDIHGEEMILRDGDERLTLNMRHDTSSYSNQPQKKSINLINVFNNSSEDFLEDSFSTNQPSGNPTFSSRPKLTSPEVKDDIFDPEGGNVLPEKLLDLDSTKDLHLLLHVNQLSGSTTYSSSPIQLLEEFIDELALITFPPKYDDDLQFDNESNLQEIEYLLYHDPIKDIDSSLKDLIDQKDESDTKNVYDDPFDSKGKKIKESKLLINELDLPCDFLLFEYDSIFSEDFSRVDALPLTNNEDKVFNPGILIQENLLEIITCVIQDKKLAISNASLMLKDFDFPLYELPFFEEVPSIPRNKKTHAKGFVLQSSFPQLY